MNDAALEAVLARHPKAEAFAFGDTPDLCAHLLALVRAGKKTATCGAMIDYIDGDDPMPAVGRRDIVLDWDGVPQLVIETTEVTFRRFRDVPEEFALAEGENESWDDWARDHKVFFDRNGGWDDKMELVCERFKVIEDLSKL